jgi:hypothetical protein
VPGYLQVASERLFGWSRAVFSKVCSTNPCVLLIDASRLCHSTSHFTVDTICIRELQHVDWPPVGERCTNRSYQSSLLGTSAVLNVRMLFCGSVKVLYHRPWLDFHFMAIPHGSTGIFRRSKMPYILHAAPHGGRMVHLCRG